MKHGMRGTKSQKSWTLYRKLDKKLDTLRKNVHSDHCSSAQASICIFVWRFFMIYNRHSEDGHEVICNKHHTPNLWQLSQYARNVQTNVNGGTIKGSEFEKKKIY